MAIREQLLHAASRDDCSPQTLRDLGDAAAKSEEDWIQALPVFLKHLSFPLHPLPDPEDKTSEHPLDTLAALALSPIIRVIRILNNANVGLTSRLERNAPDIWRWLSRWTHAALLIEGSFASSRMPILERVVTGIHGLTLHRNLIVPEAVDVVLSHFCLAGRTKRLPIIQGIRDNIGVVSSATNQATGPEQNTAVEHLALVVQSSLYPSATFRAAENTIRAAWAQRGEEILDHACMHLDLCRSEPEGTLRMDALHDARSLVLIVTEIIDNDPAKLSVFPDYLLRRVLASTLRVYNAAISLAGTQPEAQSDGAVARLCSICCQILLAVISGQQSLLRSSTLLSWALRKGMLPALIQTPRQGAGDAFEMEIAAESGTRKIDMVEYVLHFVVLRRMWDFSVYRAAKKNLGAASSPHIDHLIQRWASAYSAMNRNVKYVKPNCYYSSCPNPKIELRLQRCAGCAHVYFCSASCQRASWRVEHHRIRCKPIIARRHAGLLPATGAGVEFLSLVLQTELKLEGQRLKDELQKRILGAGSQLQVHFSAHGAEFDVGYANSVRSPVDKQLQDKQLQTLWGDVFFQETRGHNELVLVCIQGGHAYGNVLRNLQSSLVYALVFRPSWLPLAL